MKRRLIAAFLLVLCLPLLTIPLCNDKVVGHYIDKIWLHRTNTIEKLHEFEGKYKNFECDVLFVPELNDFRIGHDSPSSESLGLYLDYLGRNPERELWIDLKNLTEANCRRAESLLTAMLTHAGAYKEQLIVESRNWKALRLFTEQGYYTSCYLDIPRLDEMSDDERTQRLDSVQQVARSGAVSAVSFPASYYVFLRDPISPSTCSPGSIAAGPGNYPSFPGREPYSKTIGSRWCWSRRRGIIISESACKVGAIFNNISGPRVDSWPSISIFADFLIEFFAN